MTEENQIERTLVLFDHEVDAVISVIDELPTKANAWPLVQKMKQQITDQRKQDAPNEASVQKGKVKAELKSVPETEEAT